MNPNRKRAARARQTARDRAFATLVLERIGDEMSQYGRQHYTWQEYAVVQAVSYPQYATPWRKAWGSYWRTDGLG
jgi:hypothetical protein